MPRTSEQQSPKPLCYLDAAQIEGPLEDWRAEVRFGKSGRVGRLDGIVVDPMERRVRFLVVDNERHPNHHTYLIPIGATRVDVERQALCVDGDDLVHCQEFDRDAFRSFSFRPR